MRTRTLEKGSRRCVLVSEEHFKIIWTHTAVADLDSIFDFVGRESGYERAEAIYERLKSGIDSLSEFPRRGREVRELASLGFQEFRELIVRPYRIVFQIKENGIVLLGIFDSRRDLESLLMERALRS